MSYVSIGSQLVLQGVLVQNIQEGRPVVFTTSGAHGDLPNVIAATAGATDVFVALASVDRFARPTPEYLFQFQPTHVGVLSQLANQASVSGYEYVDQSERLYNVGPSMLQNPTLLSGWKVTLHKGGCYALMSGCFTDSDAIRVQGSPIKVGAGVFVSASSSSDSAVGYVREYRDGVLYVVVR